MFMAATALLCHSGCACEATRRHETGGTGTAVASLTVALSRSPATSNGPGRGCGPGERVTGAAAGVRTTRGSADLERRLAGRALQAGATEVLGGDRVGALGLHALEGSLRDALLVEGGLDRLDHVRALLQRERDLAGGRRAE